MPTEFTLNVASFPFFGRLFRTNCSFSSSVFWEVSRSFPSPPSFFMPLFSPLSLLSESPIHFFFSLSLLCCGGTAGLPFFALVSEGLSQHEEVMFVCSPLSTRLCRHLSFSASQESNSFLFFFFRRGRLFLPLFRPCFFFSFFLFLSGLPFLFAVKGVLMAPSFSSGDPFLSSPLLARALPSFLTILETGSPSPFTYDVLFPFREISPSSRCSCKEQGDPGGGRV